MVHDYEDFFDGIRSHAFQNSTLDTFPHQFSLQDKSSSGHLCSATLIHPLLLLTAAHCVFGKTLGGLRAVPGNDYYQQMNNNGQQLLSDVGIREIILHPDFDATTLNSDIALLRLDQRVVPSKGSAASGVIVQLPQPSWQLPGAGVLSGWGLTAPSSSGAPSVGAFEHQNLINIYRPSGCQSLYENDGQRNEIFTDKMFCAGSIGTDSCQEIQSGAVLMCEKEDSPGKWYICGIGSWGYGCGSDPNPMVYTDVSKYRSWISKELRKIWKS